MATTRRATPADLPFMVHVLRHAAGGTSGPLDVEECRTNPAIAHYIDGWTPDQVGLICLVDDTPVGAAWARNLPASDPGYGFVAPGIPELVIAISPHHREQGLGGYLLESLLDTCSANGIKSVSLSVGVGVGWLVRVCRRVGFVVVSYRGRRVVMLRVDQTLGCCG